MHFNDSLAAVEGCNDLIMGAVDGLQQGFVAAVAQAYPHEPAGIAGTVGQEREILILADENSIFPDGEIPHGAIIRLIEVHIENMYTVIPTATEIHREGNWQLIVDKKPHAVFTIK